MARLRLERLNIYLKEKKAALNSYFMRFVTPGNVKLKELSLIFLSHQQHISSYTLYMKHYLKHRTRLEIQNIDLISKEVHPVTETLKYFKSYFTEFP